MSLSRKQKIDRSFGQKTASYNHHAVLQKEMAKKLCDLLSNVAPQNILEIGCGTGFLTQNLIQKFPTAQIKAIDISKNMIAACRQKFKGYQNIDFQVADGENFDDGHKYDLIVSNLSVQWFDNPVTGLKYLTKMLNTHGALYFTTIGPSSFKEWISTLHDLNLESGIIGTPDYRGIFTEEIKQISYQSCLDFLRNFKKIGAHQPRIDYQKLTAPQLKQACQYFDFKHDGKVTWQILFGALDLSGRPLLSSKDGI